MKKANKSSLNLDESVMDSDIRSSRKLLKESNRKLNEELSELRRKI